MKNRSVLISLSLLLLILLVLSLISCKKEGLEEVSAGRYGDSFIYHEFDPPLEISITWDEQNLYGKGQDSIDVDLDSRYDMVIYLDLLNNDSLHLITGYPDPFPNCRIFLREGIEVAFCQENFPIGQGQTSTATFVDTVSFDERIDKISSWYSGIQNGIAMWHNHPSGFTPSYGSWYYTKSIKYIGIRKDWKRCGWIKVDATEPHHLKFLSCAIIRN